MNDFIDQVLTDPTVTAIGGAVAAALVALWLAAAWWAYTDAARRTDNPVAALFVAAWIVVSTPLLVPMSLAIYALARPQQTAAEHRTRRLAAELVDELDDFAPASCRSCGKTVDAAWLRCPSCTTWLALPCAQCGTWSERNLPACPFCGSEERGEPTVENLEPAAASSRPRKGRRSLRPASPGRQAAIRPGQRRTPTPDARPLAPVRTR